MSLMVIGISHHNTPLGVRERFYCDLERCKSLLLKWVEQAPDHGFLLLSTCNRLELYTDLSPSHSQFGECLNDISYGDPVFKDYAYTLEGQHCVHHLFKVACALDSKIVGENQIIGQIKQSFRLSVKIGCLKHQIQRLFEQAFYWARHLKNTRPDRSWGAAAAQWINSLPSPPKSVLMIGAGSTIAQCLKHYIHHQDTKITLCNRRPERLQILPYASCAHIIRLDALNSVLQDKHFDIIVIATASQVPLVWAKDLQSHHKPMTLIDLSVPRNTDPNIATLPGKQILSLDALPIEAPSYSEPLPAESLSIAVRNFMQWLEHDAQRHAIKAHRSKVAQTQKELLHKALRKLEHGQTPQEVLKIFSYQLTQKLLHEHSVAPLEDMVE